MLDQKTLVLNRSWLPITTTTVRRAICLIARGVAGAVHPRTFEVADWEAWVERGPADSGTLCGIGFVFPVPDVIVLRGYNGLPELRVAFSRRNVYRRDGYQCQYCGDQPQIGRLTIDHIVPRSRGGGTTWDNCVTACASCNSGKADRTPLELGLKLRRPVRIPRWPGGLDPRSLNERPVWHRFLPRMLGEEPALTGTEG